MYDMMNTTGWDFGLIALWGLHILSVVAFFSGVIFLIVLAIKTFTTAQLKTWAIGLMIVGTVVCLFTVAVIGRPWIGLGLYGNSSMNGMQMQTMGRMMQMMINHDETNPNEDHDEIEGMMRDMLRNDGGAQGMMQ